ncbi:hypothetical protein BGZ82_004361 [Podila clonocystis]|nr:hypothetical protein BGZ82_004361 [Podila clonocystis]
MVKDLSRCHFSKQCDSLKVLKVSVRDPRSFSWAVERNTDGNLQTHPENYPRNLKTLEMNMDASLTVLDDAVVAFRQTLQHLKAAGRASFESISHDSLLDPRLLRQERIGDWHVPALRTMFLKFDAKSMIYIGALDHPYLKNLSIRIKYPYVEADTDTTLGTFPGLVHPSPVWNLPRLRFLDLQGNAAMLFAFNSLDHMPVLESLTVKAGHYHQSISATSLPRLWAYRSHQHPCSSAKGDDSKEDNWKDHWSLPCGDFQRLPLVSSSKNAAILPPAAPTQCPGVDFENTQDSGFEPGMEPMVECKLRDIFISGPWEMPWHGAQFLKVVTDAIGIGGRPGDMKESAGEETWYRPGRQFKHTASEYTIQPEVAQVCGLVAIKYGVPDYYKKGACTFYSGGEIFVKAEDKIMSSTH